MSTYQTFWTCFRVAIVGMCGLEMWRNERVISEAFLCPRGKKPCKVTCAVDMDSEGSGSALKHR